jgi:hypothetical protein
MMVLRNFTMVTIKNKDRGFYMDLKTSQRNLILLNNSLPILYSNTALK